MLIATVFAGSPNGLSHLARSFHYECGLGDDAMHVRRQEDRSAAARIGAEVLHMTLPECLYRKDEAGRWICKAEADIFERDPSSELNTFRLVESTLGESIDLKRFSGVYVPLGIGHHIDHLLVRQAFERLVDRSPGLLSLQLTYYEDIPYACRAATSASPLGSTAGMQSAVCLAEQDDWQAKINAIQLYESQVRMLWGSKAAMVKELETYSFLVGGIEPGERVWISDVLIRTDPIQGQARALDHWNEAEHIRLQD